MKQLTEEQLLSNWNKLLQLVEDTFEGDRKEKLLEMYKHFEDRMVVAPASGKEEYHYCYAGGYVNHVLHVVETALEISKTYEKVGGTKDWTDEELIFSAMHHDLGKVGDLEHDYYIPQDSDWHRKNRDEIYKHNPSLQYMKVPDRALWVLQHYGVKVTDKEYIGIKLTDGMYDEANKSYLMSYNPDFGLRSNMPHILHQADMMSTYIESDEWKRGGETEEPINTKVPKTKNEQKQVDNLKQKFDELFA